MDNRRIARELIRLAKRINDGKISVDLNAWMLFGEEVLDSVNSYLELEEIFEEARRKNIEMPEKTAMPVKVLQQALLKDRNVLSVGKTKFISRKTLQRIN